MSAEPERPFAPDDDHVANEARESDVIRTRHELMARRGRRSVQVFLGVLVAITLFAAAIPLHRRYRERIRGDRIAAIARREATQTTVPGQRPPLEVILADALQRWLIALQYRDQPDRLHEIDEAFAALHQLATYDATVLARIERVHDLADAGAMANAEEIVGVFREWNSELDAAHAPYHLRPILQSDASHVLFIVSAYRVSFDGHATVGARTVRMRVLTRIDSTNMREVLLGHVSDADEGALILTNPIRDAAVTDFWPMFDTTPGHEVSPVRRAQQSFVLREMHAALPPWVITTLTRLAPAFGELVATAKAINARSSCGSQFRLAFVPARGIHSHDLEAMANLVDTRPDDDRCPAVTDDEFDTLLSNSELLSRDPQLDRALESLGTFLTRAVAVHEARHAADALDTGSVYVPLPCNGCSTDLSTLESAELSAYLASFAARATAYTSLYQACAAVGAHGGTHGTALSVAIARLTYTGCGFPPPPDLTSRARAAEQAIFERSDPVILPEAAF